MKKILLVLLTLGMLCGCQGKKEDNVIRIGVINPETGELATYGEKVRRGMTIAIEELNAQSNVVELYIEDTYADSKAAINAVQKLVNIDKVKYIIGEVSSNATLAVLPFIESKGVFLFSPGAATPKLSNSSSLFARNWPSNSAEAESAAIYAIEELLYDSAIIVYVNNDWGLGLQTTFDEVFKIKGGTIVASFIYPYENTEFRSIISKIKQYEANIIYLAGNQREMGLFMKQLRESHISLPVIANTSFLESDCLNLAGVAADGVVVPTPSYDPTDIEPSILSFSERYREKYGENPSLVDANGYDAVKLIVNAIQIVGDNPKAVADYIRNLNEYEGASGKVKFVDGDVHINTSFKMLNNGIPVDIR